jgi:hypothetical protein
METASAECFYAQIVYGPPAVLHLVCCYNMTVFSCLAAGFRSDVKSFFVEGECESNISANYVDCALSESGKEAQNGIADFSSAAVKVSNEQ